MGISPTGLGGKPPSKQQPLSSSGDSPGGGSWGLGPFIPELGKGAFERWALQNGTGRPENGNEFAESGCPSEPTPTPACTLASVFVVPVQAAFLSEASHLSRGRCSGWLRGNTWLRARPSPTEVQKEAFEHFLLTARCYFSLRSLMNHCAWNLSWRGLSGSWFCPQNRGPWCSGEWEAEALRLGGRAFLGSHVLSLGSGCSTWRPSGLGELVK